MFTSIRLLQSGLVFLVGMGIAAAQTPVITAVANDASGVMQGLPNAGIAQGSIFLVVGTNLGPSTLATASAPFQDTSVGGTSVSIVVNNTTVNALMYYASATQIGALLPSNTPIGTGALTVTTNGTASVSTSVTIVQSNFGIFTASQNGQGAAIVTFPDYSVVSAVPGTGSLGGGGPYTYGGAARPGDALVLWGTGLGPVSGNDSAGAGLGQAIANSSLTVLLGGVAAPVIYQGRSGCCIGEDQIVFTVPDGVPTGCAVPLAVQIGNLVSNYALVPVTNSGRSCTPQNPVYSGAAVQTLMSSANPFNYASFQMGRRIGSYTASGVTYQDFGSGQFAQVSLPPTARPTALTYLDTPASGTCTTTTNQSSATTALFSVLTGIDAGTIVVSGPNGQSVMKEAKSGSAGYPTTYSSTFSATGGYFSGGSYSIKAAGGIDVKAFTSSFTIAQTPTWQNSDQSRLAFTKNNRTDGITINWVGGSSAYSVEIDGASSVVNPDGTAYVSTGFSCFVPSAANTFTIPPSVLLALPASAGTEIDFKPTLPPQAVTAGSLDLGVLSFQYDTAYFITIQ
ncbi:MAG TPA: hypothetical protein VGN17_06055 [Bryobacteraceae bacterium]|jgi:uncharacterized protein (TIGR03437 family)